MPRLANKLEIERCPHCNVDRQNIGMMWHSETQSHSGNNKRYWRVYVCNRCGGLLIASSISSSGEVNEIYPSAFSVDESIPGKAHSFLLQALNTLHAPAGSVMLSASAVDAMLKEKGYKDGSLYARIEKAVEAHLITKEMATWAHEVRLVVPEKARES